MHFVDLLAFVLGLLFLHTLVAGMEDFLLHFIGLTGHRSLVGHELGGLENKTVYRDGHAVLDVYNIADM